MADNANSYENLTHSGLFSIPSKEDRNVNLQLGVYMGNTSLSIFQGPGAKPWKVGLPNKVMSQIITLLRKMRAEPRVCREPIFIQKWVDDNEKKGFVQEGSLALGIGEDMLPFVEISHNDLKQKYLFVVKPDPRYDFSNTSLSEKDTLQGLIDFLIEAFSINRVTAERMSSFKKTNMGQQGGNKGGYSNNSRSGGYNGDQNQNYRSQTFSSPDIENDLMV